MTVPRAILFIGSAEAHCVGRRLIAAGYTVKSASTVTEVARCTTEFRLAAVMMDLDLPKTDLFACIKRLRRSANRHAPVIGILEADRLPQYDEITCLTVGINDYVHTPVDEIKLEQTLRRWIV